MVKTGLGRRCQQRLLLFRCVGVNPAAQHNNRLRTRQRLRAGWRKTWKQPSIEPVSRGLA